MMKKLGIVGLIVTFGLLVGCSDEPSKDTAAHEAVQKTYTVEEKTVSTPLYFSGTIGPLKVTNVVTPFEGVVDKMYFKFGEEVFVSDRLFEINSEKLQTEYLGAISEYVSALDDFSTKDRKYNGSVELHKLGFISENDYISSKNERDESYFKMKQSARKLKDTVRKMGIRRELKNIDLKDQKTIDRILRHRQDSITIYSPVSGVALVPKSGSDGGSKVELGSSVKDGEALVAIGDVSGLSVDVSVSEIDINQIKHKQKISITSAAFPGITLKGYVDTIHKQADSSGSSQPTFPVRLVVPKLSPEESKVIHIGMSAKVKILLEEAGVITIPIQAIIEKSGQTMVKIKDKDSNEIKEVSVVTGKTSMDSIEIAEGLSPGDVVVFTSH